MGKRNDSNLNLDFSKNVNIIHSFSHSKIFNEHLLCTKCSFREYIREEKREMEKRKGKKRGKVGRERGRKEKEENSELH